LAETLTAVGWHAWLGAHGLNLFAGTAARIKKTLRIHGRW
jgi:hypothetical protein